MCPPAPPLAERKEKGAVNQNSARRIPTVQSTDVVECGKDSHAFDLVTFLPPLPQWSLHKPPSFLLVTSRNLF